MQRVSAETVIPFSLDPFIKNKRLRYLKRLMTIPMAFFMMLPCTAQKITIRENNISLPEVFRQIQQRTGCSIIFSPETLAGAPAVDLDFTQSDIRLVLKSCLAGLQLGFNFYDKVITIYRKVALDVSLYVPIEGRVQSASGESLEGASISVNGTPVQLTGAGGVFRIPVKALRSRVTVSFQGYSPQTLILNNILIQVITLQPLVSVLDQTVVQAYGKTTTRLATGSIVQVDGADMARQPAGNVLEALEGRVPGMTVRQINGVPGSDFSTLIRGRQSISQGTDPLVVVDGIPVQFNDGLLGIIGSGSAQGPSGASALNGIPISAVASIQVLKGAAATAIYGSRGSNGVVLLTLKTGAAGRPKWSADIYTGADQVVKTSPLMNTSQYLALRRQAVENDGQTVNALTVPEGYLWDTTRYTDFKKLTTGNTRLRQHAEFGVSGGDTSTTFLLSGSYHGEAAAFPGASSDDRMSVYGQLHHQTADKRVSVGLSALYSLENNRLPIQDFTYFGTLAPDAPPFVGPTGQPQWSYNGISYLNIPALENNTYRATVINQFYHLQLAYEAVPGLKLKSNLGYYQIGSVERSDEPASGQDPAFGPTSETFYTGNHSHSEVAEGIAEYSHRAGPGRLDALAGINWQGQRTSYSAVNAGDLLLSSGTNSDSVSTTNNSLIYQYEAAFGRLNYTIDNRYIVTLSGRRDGSSRFGPGNQFGNFWAVSGAWIFSKEPFIRQLHWLSFAKLRGGLGTTGNDQIGANGYTQIYNTSFTRGYQGVQGTLPSTFSNANLRWEVNYSSELAVDLGFLQNRVLLSATAYRDWTTNQLLYISLASQTGLSGVAENVPVNVVNEGLEFVVQTHNLTAKHFSWSSTISLTAPVNRLRRFPDLDNSGFAHLLVIGKSLSVVKGYHYEGVNDASGLFQFRRSGQNDTLDMTTGGNLDLHAYGGCDQRLRYRNWQLDVFVDFRLQSGYNPYVILYQSNPPGFPGFSMESNAPEEWLHRWQKPGDHAPLQQVTENYSSNAFTALQNYISSDAQSVNASFVRLKSMMVSWQLTGNQLRHTGMRECRVYVKGQNLWTKTRFPVTDPETQDPTVLPPVRTVVAGVKMTF